jgi:hypothetical protein
MEELMSKRCLVSLACLALAAPITAAPAGIQQQVETFEANSGWGANGQAGFDRDKPYARTGRGNAWVRNLRGWSSVTQWYLPAPGARDCAVQAWIRISPNVTDGYFSVFRGDGQRPSRLVTEVKLRGPGPANPENRGYNPYTLEFRNEGGPYLVHVGNWGNSRDAWLQIDDVTFQCTLA